MLTMSRAHSNSATNSLPMSNSLLKFSPSAIFHHSMKLNVGLTDVLHPACRRGLLSGATYVPGLFMFEKLQKVILTGSGTSGELPLDARRPIIQVAASYAEPLISQVSYAR